MIRTEAYFKECVDSWRDTALDGYDFSVLDMNTGLVDHNVLRMQSIRYITDPRLVWTFAALFSPETGKACIISCFATTPVERTEGVVRCYRPYDLNRWWKVLFYFDFMDKKSMFVAPTILR